MRYKMKTLEQLGISPAPWRINDHASVLDRYFEIISGQYGPYNWYNSSLIAAAPELYEALAAMLSCAEKEAPFATGSGRSIAMDMARKALAKAAGESEVEV